MFARLTDWIWHIDGTVVVSRPMSSQEAFDRLDPLFHQPGTSFERARDTLTFRKKDPAAQDKMSIIDRGTLQFETAQGGGVLRYRMTSKALLACFLAPLMFLAFAQLTVAIGKWEKSSPSTEEKAKKKDDKKDFVPQQSWIDKTLGSPAPEKPKKDKKDEDEGRSPTSAYVFAALFAALYVIGRILEARVIQSLFRKRLLGETTTSPRAPTVMAF